MSFRDTSLPMPSHLYQIDALQLLRAIAVILVIWFHSSQVLGLSGSQPIPDLGIFGVDIFFVISGFILSLSVMKVRDQPGIKPMADFMKRRFIRIYPIYWVVSLLMLARYAHEGLLEQNSYLAAFFLLPEPHFPMEHLIMGVSWTLIFEMSFYCMLGLILVFSIRSAVPILITMLCSLVVIGTFTGIRHSVLIVVANPIELEFVFGAVIALAYMRLRGRRVLGMVLTAAGAVEAFLLRTMSLPHIAIGMQNMFSDRDVPGRVATWGVSATLIVAGVIFWNPSMKHTLGKAFVLIGNASYSIYITCTVVMEFATRLFYRLDPPSLSIWYRLSYAFYEVVVLVTAGLICYIYVEKPMLKVLQKKLLNSPPARSAPSFAVNANSRTPSQFLAAMTRKSAPGRRQTRSHAEDTPAPNATAEEVKGEMARRP
ncbi:MAG: acyltransferase [Acidobacteriaceae bacterium]